MQLENVVLVDGVRSAFARGAKGKLVATRLDEAGARVLRALLERQPKVQDSMIGLETEASRLALLHSLELLDTPAQTSYDAITRLAHQLTGRPIALIGLVDADRTWVKSRIGLDAAQSPREISFCHFAIEAEDLFEVPDAHADPRFSVNPLVTGAPHVRYYAGVPLRVTGLPVGTVCVVDHVPHRLSEAQLDGLGQLGPLTTELLERRLASRAKSEIIGHMNHEMRTPMNAILGFGQLLQARRI